MLSVVMTGLLFAATCPPVETALDGDRWTAVSERAFRAELAVETGRTSQCASDNARVRLVWQGDEPVGVSVTWQTGATERVLRRSFDPKSVPVAGLMLALAAVTGELLNEAALTWPEPKVEVVAPPPEEPEKARTVAVLARLGGALYSGGSTFGAGAVAVRLAPSRVEIDLSLKGSGALSRASALGSVSLAGFGGAAGLAVRALDLGPVSLLPFAQLEVTHLWALVSAGDGATARATTAITVAARGGLELAFRPGGSWWALGLSIGAPVRGASFTDGTGSVSAVSGVEGGLTLSAGPAW